MCVACAVLMHAVKQTWCGVVSVHEGESAQMIWYAALNIWHGLGQRNNPSAESTCLEHEFAQLMVITHELHVAPH